MGQIRWGVRASVCVVVCVQPSTGVWLMVRNALCSATTTTQLGQGRTHSMWQVCPVRTQAPSITCCWELLRVRRVLRWVLALLRVLQLPALAALVAPASAAAEA